MFKKEGGAYPDGCTVEFRMADGTVKSYKVAETSMSAISDGNPSPDGS